MGPRKRRASDGICKDGFPQWFAEGTLFRKHFPGHGPFDDTMAKLRKPFYLVRYSDGDEEELDRSDEVNDGIKMFRIHTARRVGNITAAYKTHLELFSAMDDATYIASLPDLHTSTPSVMAVRDHSHCHFHHKLCKRFSNLLAPSKSEAKLFNDEVCLLPP